MTCPLVPKRFPHISIPTTNNVLTGADRNKPSKIENPDKVDRALHHIGLKIRPKKANEGSRAPRSELPASPMFSPAVPSPAVKEPSVPKAGLETRKDSMDVLRDSNPGGTGPSVPKPPLEQDPILPEILSQSNASVKDPSIPENDLEKRAIPRKPLKI